LKRYLLLACLSATVLGGCGREANAPPKSGGDYSATSSVAATQSGDPVLIGAGDIADCADLSGAQATAKIIEATPGTVFTAGDNAYEEGTAKQFRECYGPTWGRFKDRTRPSPGNHEFHSSGATPYFDYFGANAGDPKTGYYSYDLGDWHIIVLNSECEQVGGCQAGSNEEKWLREDLGSHHAACTLAYWHKPLFSSGAKHGNDPEVRPFWQDLYAAKADVVINGHDHDYERFAPQDPDGTADSARGIREFVVGTGGKNHRPFGPPEATSEVRNSDTFGVLKLTLRAKGYDWEFIPEAGKSFRDAGRGDCH
jgi:acid phosphatase type 7